MKRALILITILAFLTIGTTAQAAGSVTPSLYNLSMRKDVLVIKLACIGDAADGTVPVTTINQDVISAQLPKKYWEMGYYVYELWTVAGAPSPDPADATLKDSLGRQLFDQDNVIAASGTTEGSITKYRSVIAPLVITQENQATTSAQWDVYIMLTK